MEPAEARVLARASARPPAKECRRAPTRVENEDENAEGPARLIEIRGPRGRDDATFLSLEALTATGYAIWMDVLRIVVHDGSDLFYYATNRMDLDAFKSAPRLDPRMTWILQT